MDLLNCCTNFFKEKDLTGAVIGGRPAEEAVDSSNRVMGDLTSVPHTLIQCTFFYYAISTWISLRKGNLLSTANSHRRWFS